MLYTVISVSSVILFYFIKVIKTASASGGVLSVNGNEVTLLPATFEFSDEIDLVRAVRAKEKAEKLLASAKEEREILHAKLKLMKALSRISVADNKR